MWRRGQALDKRIALPVCGTARSLSFRLMPGYGAMFLRPGPYGTQEPTEDCLPLPLADLDGALMLVPGLSFDGDGYRLGYGGGYYDTLLYTLAAHGIAPITVGVTYACCLAPCLPHQTHDVPVRYVLSEGRLAPAHAKRDDFAR